MAAVLKTLACIQSCSFQPYGCYGLVDPIQAGFSQIREKKNNPGGLFFQVSKYGHEFLQWNRATILGKIACYKAILFMYLQLNSRNRWIYTERITLA